MLWSLPLLPMAAAIVMVLVGARRAVVAIALGSIATLLGLAIWSSMTLATATFRWGPGLTLTLTVDGFVRVMVILIPLVALPVVGFAASTERHGRGRLLALLTAFVGAMQLLVLAADLLTLLVAWELVGAISWALVGHGWRDADNGRSAAQVFVTTRVGDLGLYLAAGLVFASVGTFDLTAIGQVEGPQLHAVAAGILLAAAAKSAQLPFSPWLFSAMAGPTPVSALLHSATLVSAGAYVLIRLAPSLDAVGWFLPALVSIGAATALVGGLVALTQEHIKRVLAGSTAAQYGLMFLAVGVGSTAAAGAQLVAHALFKSLLFLAAGVAIHAVGHGRVSGMGLGRVVPSTAQMAAVGALALAAVPPLGGAWSKEQIVAAAWSRSGWAAAVVLLVAFLTAAYATRLWVLAFGPSPAASDRHGPAASGPGRAELAALGVLAAGSAGLGVLWLPGAAPVVESLTGGSLAHGGLGELVAALIAIGAAIVGVVALHRRGRLVELGLPDATRAFVADWLGLPTLARVAVVDPVLALARGLASFDDRVIDAGVRGAAALAATISRTFARFGELTFAGAVHGLAGGAVRSGRFLRQRAERAVEAVVGGVAAGTDLFAVLSRRADERGVDTAVEGLALGTGSAGRHAQQTQTGLSHHYYLYVSVGAALLVLVLTLLR